MLRTTEKFKNLNFLHLQKTRIASPSEWQGLTENGNKIFCSFLCGELSIGSGETYEEAKKNRELVIDYRDDETDFLSNEELMRVMRWRKVVVEPRFSDDLYDSDVKIDSIK